MADYGLDQIMEFLLPHIRAAMVQPEGGPKRYGLSPKSQVVGGALQNLEQVGQKPPLPADTQGFPLLVALLTAAQGAQGQQAPQPSDPPAAPMDPGGLRGLNAPSAASANSAQNVELLRKLIGNGGSL